MRSTRITPLDIGGLGIFDLLAQGLTVYTHEPARYQREDDVVEVPPAPRRTWLERLDDWFRKQRQNDVEAYLGQSQDVFELEARIRDMERSPHGYM